MFLLSYFVIVSGFYWIGTVYLERIANPVRIKLYLRVQLLSGIFLTLKSFFCLTQTSAQKLHLRLRALQLQL